MRTVLLTALVAVPIFAQHRGGSPAPPAARAYPHPAPPPVSRPYYPHYPRTVIVPYPIFYGGGYSGYAPGPLGSDYGYSEQPAPVAAVNPNYQPDSATQAMIDFSNVPAAQATDDTQLKDDQPTIFLIALTDHTVVAAIAYWVDGDTLHYFTSGNTHNQVSLSLIDRDMTQRLNKESGIDLKLPAPKQ